ncbi:hypothetical protein D3C86_1795920 [compost metagenome]
MGTLLERICPEVCPYISEDDATVGRIRSGISNRVKSSVSQSKVSILYNIVLEALDTSVTWTSPLVKFQIIQLSTVPKASSPAFALSLAP